MIYFDYASTTPVRKQIIDTYIKVLSSYYGNSDSMHEVGRTANKLMEQSREQIAQLLKVDKDEVIFTSCASEANNLAIRSARDCINIEESISLHQEWNTLVC